MLNLLDGLLRSGGLTGGVELRARAIPLRTRGTEFAVTKKDQRMRRQIRQLTASCIQALEARLALSTLDESLGRL
ncbi:MAG: hypothetical protein AAFQ82_09005, partial [Myxococcota bacterium]